MNQKQGIRTLKILVIFMVLVIVATVSIFLIISGHEQSKSNDALSALKEEDPRLKLVENCFRHLSETDNSFRLYALSYDPAQLYKYKTGIDSLVLTLESLKISFESVSPKENLVSRAGNSMIRKLSISANFIRLKRLTDSLLLVAISADSLKIASQKGKLFFVKRYKPNISDIRIDTLSVVTTTEKNKKGFFGKIKSFFVGEKEKSATNQQLRLAESGTASISSDSLSFLEQINETIADNSYNYYQKQLKIQKIFREKLERQERLLIQTNNELMDNLKHILNEIYVQEQKHDLDIQNQAINIVGQATKKLNLTGIISLGLIIILTSLIFICIRKINLFHKMETDKLIRNIINLNAELENRVSERTAQLVSANQELEFTNLKLETSNQELEAFSYSVSHDLRAPVRRIEGLCSMLGEDYSTLFDEQGKDLLKRITDSSLHMNQLIEDMLKLSRITRQTVSKSPCNLSEMAAQISEELKFAYTERDVVCKIEEGIIVDADPHLLQIALQNLLDNAWKYSSKVEHPEVTVGSEIRDNKRVIFIKDNGVGFDMSQAGKLFTPFQRLHSDEQFKGTGVGLATVKRIIVKHGGNITVQSEPGKGTTFSFIFE
ncbi:MAG TPA: ATP-binding protein [Bacteroidales bacterium]|nr:ATP-binding protein [Bacteroidales bacterium]